MMFDVHHLGGGVAAVEIGQVNSPEATLAQHLVCQDELVLGYFELVEASPSPLPSGFHHDFCRSCNLCRVSSRGGKENEQTTT